MSCRVVRRTSEADMVRIRAIKPRMFGLSAAIIFQSQRNIPTRGLDAFAGELLLLPLRLMKNYERQPGFFSAASDWLHREEACRCRVRRPAIPTANSPNSSPFYESSATPGQT